MFQVALEVIEELCYEMGLHNLEAMEEYAIFLVTNRGELVFCLARSHKKHTQGAVLVHKGLLLVRVSGADPLTDHMSDCSLVSSCGRKSHMSPRWTAAAK